MEKEILNSEVVSIQEEEKGATMVEYVVLLALIAVVCIAAITVLGEETSEKFSAVANTLENTTN